MTHPSQIKLLKSNHAVNQIDSRVVNENENINENKSGRKLNKIKVGTCLHSKHDLEVFTSLPRAVRASTASPRVAQLERGTRPERSNMLPYLKNILF